MHSEGIFYFIVYIFACHMHEKWYGFKPSPSMAVTAVGQSTPNQLNRAVVLSQSIAGFTLRVLTVSRKLDGAYVLRSSIITQIVSGINL